MIKLINAVDIRDGRFYSEVVIKERSRKWFIADQEKPVVDTEAAEIVEILTGGAE